MVVLAQPSPPEDGRGDRKTRHARRRAVTFPPPCRSRPVLGHRVSHRTMPFPAGNRPGTAGRCHESLQLPPSHRCNTPDVLYAAFTRRLRGNASWLAGARGRLVRSLKDADGELAAWD